MCSPAIPLTAIEPTCTPLRFGAYCKKHGINLESYVFENNEDQQIASSTTVQHFPQERQAHCLNVGIRWTV